MTQDSQTLVLPDGRILGYAVYGAAPSPGIPTVLYCHGFPGSRTEAAIFPSTKYNFCVVSIDRPSMGLSTFQPSRRILDWTSDALAVLGHLKIEQFHVVGDSVRSPYALACAKDIPRSRLLSISVVSGIYPLSLGTEGMLFSVKALLFGGSWLPQSIMRKLLDWEFGHGAKNADPRVFEDIFMKAMAKRHEKDLACLDDLEFRKVVIESMRGAFMQGSEGPAWDCALYCQWGFHLDDISGENVAWHAGHQCPVRVSIKGEASSERL